MDPGQRQQSDHAASAGFALNHLALDDLQRLLEDATLRLATLCSQRFAGLRAERIAESRRKIEAIARGDGFTISELFPTCGRCEEVPPTAGSLVPTPASRTPRRAIAPTQPRDVRLAPVPPKPVQRPLSSATQHTLQRGEGSDTRVHRVCLRPGQLHHVRVLGDANAQQLEQRPDALLTDDELRALGIM